MTSEEQRNKQFYSSCMDWHPDKVDDLIEMINHNRQLSRKTFVKHVDKYELERLEESLGYADHLSRGLTMSADRYVTYHRSMLFGKTCYYFRWSAIEYVFV